MQEEDRLLKRMTIDPDVVVGKPVIKGTRLTVEYMLNLFAHGATSEEMFAKYDGLSREDLQASLLFAAKSLGSTFPSCENTRTADIPVRLSIAEQDAFADRDVRGTNR